jgi:2,5-furandicarboxylate decarboxylase 1
MPSSLRTYLKDIKKEIVKIKKEVDPNTQLGDLASQSDRPLFFENIKGYPDWKVCDLLIKTRNTQAIALKTDPDQVVPELAKRIVKGPGKTRMLKTGPVKAKVLKGEKADLSKIPFCLHTPKDGGLYIGSGMCVVKDPDTGAQNVAMHRIHIKGPHRVAVSLFSPHSKKILQKYHESGKAAPMAVVIGHHPCFEIATNYFGPHDTYSEHELASSLLGETIDMVKCEMSDITVPAHAEIVIEGEIPPGDMEDEGPFCEFHGIYSSGVAKKPGMDIKAITMREDAIFRHLNATPYTDHQCLVALPGEALLYDQLKRKGINVKEVHIPSWGGLFIVIIKMVPAVAEQVRDALMTTLYSPSLLFTKIAIAVDEDMDSTNAEDILYSIGVRMNPQMDMVNVDRTVGLPYDLSLPDLPGAPPLRVGGKLGIDATKPPLIQKELRSKMERVNPEGWGKVFLKDFI